MSWPKFVSNKNKDIFELESSSPMSDIALYSQLFTHDPIFVSKEDIVNGFYIGWDDPEQKIPSNLPKKTTKCEHEWEHRWVKYIGFNEIYEFCEICDKKRPIKNE